MEGYLCENCEEYSFMDSEVEGKVCKHCGDWVWNPDFYGNYEDDSDEASVAHYLKQEQPVGKYRPQFNEYGERNW